MTDLDYSIYYGQFHPDSDSYAETVANYMVREIGPYVPQNRDARILDIGCGYGFALRALRKLGYKNIQGIEVSREQARRATEAGFTVDVVPDTEKWLSSQQSKFSMIILRDVLEHVEVPKQIPMLRAIYNVLAQGGCVLVQVPNANAILAARWRYNDFTHYSSFTEHSLYFVLKSAGFERIEIGTEKRLQRPSFRFWKSAVRSSFARSLRLFLVRWVWAQIFKAELPGDPLESISFELNLRAVAYRRA